MIGETTYKITVSRADSDVIKNLVDILENCPMGLNNDDYVEIMKTIAYHNYETDIEGVVDHDWRRLICFYMVGNAIGSQLL